VPIRGSVKNLWRAFQVPETRKLNKTVNTPTILADLTQHAPHSPRNRIAGFAIASRAVDKCRASIAGTLGEYHYNCPLDNVLFTFKGITGDQFKTAVIASKTDDEVGAWLLSNGTPKTAAEVTTWSDEVEARSPMETAEKRDSFIHKCSVLGLIPETSTTFDLLEADDQASFTHKSSATNTKRKTSVGKSDDELKIDVLAELEFDPSVKVSDIGVLVSDGTVTLNGYATSFGERFAAVRSAKRVAGVKAIADDIEVRLPNSSLHSDGDIASAAIHQINYNTTIPKGVAQVVVRGGWITLQGEFEWWHEKNAVESAVHHLAGVKGVTNLITLKSPIAPEDLELIIKAALERSAHLNADRIQVEGSGGKVILLGKVESYAQREEAEQIAWRASGVCSVDNQLEVEWFWGEEQS
jgi:osmotically-inducible protein OsmY